MAKKKGRSGGGKKEGSDGYDGLTRSYRDVPDIVLMADLDLNDIDQMFEFQIRKENS